MTHTDVPDPVVFFTAYIREHGTKPGTKIAAVAAYGESLRSVGVPGFRWPTVDEMVKAYDKARTAVSS